MSETRIYDIPEAFARDALIDAAQYQAMYE